MKDLCRRSMLYNIKPLYLHRVFHGIRFKVNNLRLAVRDGWLFSFIGILYFCGDETMKLLNTH